MVLSSGKAASDLLPIVPLVATKHENVNEGCSDMCDSRQNLCFVGSRCINHYSGISCDCFGTHYEGEHCDIYSEYEKESMSKRERGKESSSLPLTLSVYLCMRSAVGVCSLAAPFCFNYKLCLFACG